jgi:Uma2 family endonuclease
MSPKLELWITIATLMILAIVLLSIALVTLEKDRITWGVDPAPDLVIEVDVTSFTDIADYAPYQVPEVWSWKQQQLLIYHWSSTGYQLQPTSRYCPRLNVSQLTADYLQIARNQSTSAALRNLRQQLAQAGI